MKRFDPAWLDEQYNNRARVPEHPAFLERWTARSADARRSLASELDLRYGDLPGETLDVFPSSSSGAPVLVYIHGGWWRSLDKSDQSFIAPGFVRDGAMVVVPNYALCPAVTIDTIATQMVEALAWVYRNAGERFGADPQSIVVAGHSAGGHLAAMMLCRDWQSVVPDLPPRLVKSAHAISGLFDLEPLRHTPFLMRDLQLTATSARQLSPVHLPTPAGRLYASVGALESEEFLRQNRLIQEAWGRAAVPVCEMVPDAHHFSVVDEWADAASSLHGHTLQLLGLVPSVEA